MAGSSHNLLGTVFDVVSDRPGHLMYPGYFLGAYDRNESSGMIHSKVHITISEGTFNHSEGRKEIRGVHRSKHGHWNFNAEVHREGSNTEALWIGRNAKFSFDNRCTEIQMVIPENETEANTGENLFHLMRSVALYKRKPAYGAMLHASAVEIGGKAVLFAGHSNSGKTTLFTELVLNHGATPLSNDRVLLAPDHAGIQIGSWPSYCSYCEGTLLNYPWLATAAIKYEAEGSRYKTISWPDPLEAVFTKNRKRIYPMGWFTEATGRTYSMRSRLGAFVIQEFRPGIHQADIQLVDLDKEENRIKLAEEIRTWLFDEHEPSFLPWHGLNIEQHGRFLPGDLVETIYHSNIPVIRAFIPMGDLQSINVLKEYLK